MRSPSRARRPASCCWPGQRAGSDPGASIMPADPRGARVKHRTESGPAWWSRDATELMRELGSSLDGLSQAEAQARLRAHGPNAVDDRPALTAGRLLLRQVANPLVLIL